MGQLKMGKAVAVGKRGFPEEVDDPPPGRRDGTEREADGIEPESEGADIDNEGKPLGTEIMVVREPRPVVGKLVGKPVRLRSVGRLTKTDGRATDGVMETRVGRPLGPVVERRLVPTLGMLTGGMIPEGKEVGMMFVREGRLPLGRLVGKENGGVMVGRAVKSLRRELTGTPPPPFRIEEISPGIPCVGLPIKEETAPGTP